MSSEKKGSQKISYEDLSAFFENMAMMLRAGISVQEAVSLLREEGAREGSALSGKAGESTADPAAAAAAASVKKPGGSGGVLASAVNSIAWATEAGDSLGGAMKETGAFPSYAVDMVTASEYNGKLEDTLFHLSDYYRTTQRMNETFTSAVRYPIILLILVIAVLAGMLFMVFPSFYGVYQNLTGSVAASSFNYVGISFAICRAILVMMVLLLALILIGVHMWRNGRKAKIMEILSSSSIFRKLFDSLDLYRFTSCFDMFISGGEMQDEALKKSLVVVESGVLKKKLEKCAAKMDAGESFSQAACDVSLYDPVSNRMLIPAERSGMLDSVLVKILGNLRAGSEKSISTIANTIEPILTGSLMLFIGAMLISLMLPLIGIMNTIG